MTNSILSPLQPIASIHNRNEFKRLLESDELKQLRRFEAQFAASLEDEKFTIDGFCVPCGKNVSFLVDMQVGGRKTPKGWLPNWRERLECPICKMNNRQRLISTLIKQLLSVKPGQTIYLMEQITSIYNWVHTTFTDHKVIGSEYLGPEYQVGTVINGVRHENIENLSFNDAKFDIIISNDVFEHVPNPLKAFAECVRVLKKGGVMLTTIPFHSASDESVTRARITNGNPEKLLPPVYHSNPVSPGSLVFTDFGWDVLTHLKASGFSDVSIDVYVSQALGHLGGGQLIFSCSLGVQ